MNPEDSVEITAPSVEEAILLGLTRLRATRDQVDIEVLEEGSKGFLGLGSHEAKVRLTRRDVTIEPRVDLASLKAQEEAADEAAEEEEEPQAPSPAPEKKPAPAPRSKREKAPEKAQVEERKPSKAQAPAEEEKPPLKQPEKAPAKPKKKPVPRESHEKKGGVDRDAVEAVALEVAEHVFADFEVEVDTEWREEDRPTLWISLSGPDASPLVGRRARTLSSVQYVMRALVHHKIDGQYYLVVDADGYRERRHRSLRSLAERKANEAVQKQRTIRLRHMPASERRIIHMTLREDDRVETKSVGSGRHRAVTIIPD
jgi:spoIIIJ-associated protein